VKLAAIDIGTNSIHMVIVETGRERGFEVVDRAKDMVKLGAGLFESHCLTERAFEAGLETLRRYTKLAESSGVDEILAVATSATREAENGSEFLEAIFRETGLRPRVISGVEEGRLIFRAVRHAIDLKGQRVLAIDIGGGSVEIVVGQGDRVELSESLRLGVQRLLGRQGSSDALSTRQHHELVGYIQGVAADAVSRARRIGFERAIGTSGTIRTVSEAAHLLAGGEPWRTVNAEVARRKDIKELVKKLVDRSQAERARMPGIGEPRSDAIHLGAMVLDQVLELAAQEEITVCDASLREGVILDFLDGHGSIDHGPAAIADVRRRSVVELARKYDRDDPRERHIAGLSLQIFDAITELHGLGPEERELLEFAALLHGIGHYIDFKNRNRHSRYIIRHSGLRGFTDEEVELIGQIVRYHRSSAPSRRHPRFALLPKPAKHVVRVLSGALRIAVALDRGRSQVVKELQFRTQHGGLECVVVGAGDLELELWAARRNTRPLSRAIGRPIRIALASESRGAAVAAQA
jgi:exopolyphosphatase / guanosine-5'-triphosphate,3'-diphosphate pyrophosphatase